MITTDAELQAWIVRFGRLQEWHRNFVDELTLDLAATDPQP